MRNRPKRRGVSRRVLHGVLEVTDVAELDDLIARLRCPDCGSDDAIVERSDRGATATLLHRSWCPQLPWRGAFSRREDPP